MAVKRILIAGGGLSGLAAAHRLLELRSASAAEYQIEMLEASARFGGILETRQSHGCLLECGAESFITEKPWALELCGRLGIDKHLTGTNPAERFSYVLSGGRLRKIPEGFYLTAPGNPKTFLFSDILPWHSKLRVLCEVFVPARKSNEEETVGAFIRRRFGRGCLERIGQPMIGGIYGGDIERLSLKATFPKFIEMEKSHGSVIRALLQRGRSQQDKGTAGPRYNLFVSFTEGMAVLVNELHKRIQNHVNIHAETSAAQIRFSDGEWVVTAEDGREFRADAVCLALPVHVQARLLQETDVPLAAKLGEIELTSSITMNLVYAEESFKRRPQGFGFVVPENEKSALIGCTFSSLKFKGRAPEEKVLLRAFVRSDLMDTPDQELAVSVHGELSRLLGINSRPAHYEVNRYRRVMPQYHVGHRSRIDAVEEMTARHAGLFLAGNAFDGVGIPDCIHRSENQAERILEYLNT